MRRPMRTFVIEEDEHLQNLRKIIKRDFFSTSTAQDEAQTLNLSLNDYLTNYKSNENQFFSEMVQANNEEWKQNHWWIDKQDKMLMITNSEKFEALPYHNMLATNAQINGINTSITKQDAKNSFFFNREKNFGSLQCAEYEEAKKVVYKNCRLEDPHAKAIERIGMMIKHEEITPVRINQKGWEAKDSEPRRIPDSDRRQNDEDDGPLMTWGEIQSTPMRISGPEFKIPDTPQRQILLSNLNNKINKDKTQQTKKSQHAMKILGSLTPSMYSKNRFTSSIRRVQDSVKREKNVAKDERNDISGLLNIKK